MNEGIHLDLDTWIVPGQIRKANLYCLNDVNLALLHTHSHHTRDCTHTTCAAIVCVDVTQKPSPTPHAVTQ